MARDVQFPEHHRPACPATRGTPRTSRPGRPQRPATAGQGTVRLEFWANTGCGGARGKSRLAARDGSYCREMMSP
jgi:hypothetical protein